jgi:hypothetical protein
VSVATKNAAFNVKFMGRNTEYSERSDSASTVKPAAVAAYIQFCTVIEQIVNLTPSDTALALFNQMDELRKEYHSQEGGSNGKEETAPTDSKQ